jgi:lysophospholipid acyltransferase (LPLAT)-like uncharacterized protein
MKLRNPLLIRILSAAFAAGFWCWLRTLNFRRFGLDGRSHPTDPREQQVLYVFWHEGIFGTLCTPGRLQVLISQHTDGEWIAQVCSWLGLDVVRGSTTRGGRQAVRTMLRTEAGAANLAITPDGPRGPRRQMQPGALWIASATGIPIVLIGVGWVRAWRMNSWDQFAIPVPGSSVTGVFSQPIHIPENLDRDDLERWQTHLERELTRLSDLADSWAARIRELGAKAEPPARELVPLPNFGEADDLPAQRAAQRFSLAGSQRPA